VQRAEREASTSAFKNALRMEGGSAHAKRNAESSTPLHDMGIVQRVLSYVGSGEWRFVATVCSSWRDLYSAVADKVIRRIAYSTYYERGFTCVPQMTLYSSMFSSPSRVRLAAESGVDNSKESYQFAAGRSASIETLVVARELGMEFTVETMQGAARYDNKLHIMQKGDTLQLRSVETSRCCGGLVSAAALGTPRSCKKLLLVAT
jgi:hypothetical protein